MNNDLIFILNTLMNACRNRDEPITSADMLCVKVDKIITCPSRNCHNCLLGYRHMQIYPRLLISRWINEQ